MYFKKMKFHCFVKNVINEKAETVKTNRNKNRITIKFKIQQ